MVTTKTSSQPAKRKKTEDMPDSPPKRVTRARAKASSGDAEPSKPKVTKIITASAKAEGMEEKRRAKAKVPSSKTSKRGTTKGVEDVDTADGLAVSEPVVKEEPTKPRTRTKKMDQVLIHQPVEIKSILSVPPSRRHAKPSSVEQEVPAAAPRPRGRPKKIVVTSISLVSDEPSVAKPDPAAKAVRSRAAAPAGAAKSNPAPSTASAPARKRVKFQEEPDKEKENIQQASTLKGSISASTGLKAKPVRIPAASRATTRSKKAQDDKKQPDGEGKLEHVRPLSPKKVKQVAKSCSMGSEDELCRERTPVKALSKSPMKPPMSILNMKDKAAPRLDFDEPEMPASPTKSPAFTILTSPARRPPPSPFKDSMKVSPKRVNLGDSMVSLSKSLQSPTKSTLLQSPAKRLVSPVKFMENMSPQKSNIELPMTHSVEASKAFKQLKPPNFSPSKVISSPLRAVRSPENPFRVSKLKSSEQEVEALSQAPLSPRALDYPEPPAFDKVLPGVASEQNLTAPAETTVTEKPSSEASEEVGLGHPNDGTILPEIDIDDISIVHEEALSTTPPEPAAPFTTASFSFASRQRCAVDESDSEDDLVSNDEGNKIPVVQLRTLPPTFQSKIDQGGFEWSPIPNGIVQPFSMTPLAKQLGGWTASSSEKTTSTASLAPRRGLFSPITPNFFDQAIQESGISSSEIKAHGDPGSPPKVSFFEECFYPEISADQEQDPGAHSFAYDAMSEKVDEVELSQSFEEYGDENALPINLDGFQSQPEGVSPDLTCTPATEFAYPREIHTVSKVPLRPAGDDSPITMPRKRSKSLACSTQTSNMIAISKFQVLHHHGLPSKESYMSDFPESSKSSMDENTSPTKSVIDLPTTPGSIALSTFATPGQTVRRDHSSNILKGAVVYVDVHTSEGADASGIFLDLLTQMGARCVKQWLWKPRHSTFSPDDYAASASDSDGPGNKIGITHVVYKDGGKRTLEKVREARGVVLCVGVGWVLEYVHSAKMICAVVSVRC